MRKIVFKDSRLLNNNQLAIQLYFIRIIFTLSLICGLANLLTAQSMLIKGRILDTVTNQPIDYVSVYLSTNTGSIKEFTHTDQEGHYKLSIVTISDSINIVATILGYRKKSFPVYIKDSISIIQNFFLSPTSIDLQEIIVAESSVPILQKNDTTTYNLASYIDSTEYSVEDVLKKLPGVHVSEEGGIKVNGKPIDKVLIEGDDMFGNNYTIGTRNIRANIIDKVQVIDRYQDNPVLKGIKESDKIVLNLSVKEEKKNIISGTSTIGVGYGEEIKNYLHTNLFSISKKAKTFLLGNFNNIGFDAKGELFVGYSIDDPSIDNNTDQSNGLIDLPTIQNIGLPEEFTNRRQLGLGSISQIFNVNPSFKVKLTGVYYHERNEQDYFNENRFFSSLDTLNFQEVSTFLSKNKSTDIVIQTDYLSDHQKKSLKTYSNLAIQLNRVNLVLDRKGNGQSDFIPQLIKEQPIHIFNALEYTHKINSNSVAQVIVNHLYNANNQNLTTRYTLYPQYFGLDNLDSLNQSTNLVQSKAQVLFRYLYNKNIALNLEIGYDRSKHKIFSNTLLSDVNEDKETQQLSGNDLDFEYASPFFKAILKKDISILNITAGLHSSRTAIKNISSSSTIYWLFNPFLQLQMPMNENTSFKFLYQYDTELPDLNTLNEQFVFQDYQVVSKGILNFKPLKGHKMIGSFNYTDVLNSFYFNADGYFSISNDFLGNAFDFSKLVFFQSFTRPTPFQSFGGSISADKLFFDFNSRFLLRYTYNVHSSQNDINSTTQEMRLQSNEILLDYGSAFDTPLNFYLTNTIRFINSDISARQEEQNQLITWNTKLKLLYRPSKKFYVDMSWYHIRNRTTDRQSNNFYGAEANAYFTFEYKKRRNTVSASIVNIPNQSQFIINNIGAFSQSQYGLNAVPRFFIIKWDSSF